MILCCAQHKVPRSATDTDRFIKQINDNYGVARGASKYISFANEKWLADSYKVRPEIDPNLEYGSLQFEVMRPKYGIIDIEPMGRRIKADQYANEKRMDINGHEYESIVMAAFDPHSITRIQYVDYQTKTVTILTRTQEHPDEIRTQVVSIVDAFAEEFKLTLFKDLEKDPYLQFYWMTMAVRFNLKTVFQSVMELNPPLVIEGSGEVKYSIIEITMHLEADERNYYMSRLVEKLAATQGAVGVFMDLERKTARFLELNYCEELMSILKNWYRDCEHVRRPSWVDNL